MEEEITNYNENPVTYWKNRTSNSCFFSEGLFGTNSNI